MRSCTQKAAAAAAFTLATALGLVGASASAAVQDDCSCALQQAQRIYPTVTVNTHVRVTTLEWETYSDRELVTVTKWKDESYYEPVKYRLTRIECGCEGAGQIIYKEELRTRQVPYTTTEWQTVQKRRQVKKIHDEPLIIVIPAEDVAKYARAG